MTLFYCWSKPKGGGRGSAHWPFWALERIMVNTYLDMCSFNVDIFSVPQCITVTQLVSGFLLEEIALCVAIHLVCPWEEGIQEPPLLPSLSIALSIVMLKSTVKTLFCSAWVIWSRG